MKIYIVGNESVEEDSVPHELLPQLRKAFPSVNIVEVDPTESFVPEEGSIIIDTVVGIKTVQWFENLDDFLDTKRVSVHDYDLGLHLKLLQKLRKVHVRILGIPAGKRAEDVCRDVVKYLQAAVVQKLARLL